VVLYGGSRVRDGRWHHGCRVAGLGRERDVRTEAGRSGLEFPGWPSRDGWNAIQSTGCDDETRRAIAVRTLEFQTRGGGHVGVPVAIPAGSSHRRAAVGSEPLTRAP